MSYNITFEIRRPACRCLFLGRASCKDYHDTITLYGASDDSIERLRPIAEEKLAAKGVRFKDLVFLKSERDGHNATIYFQGIPIQGQVGNSQPGQEQR